MRHIIKVLLLLLNLIGGISLIAGSYSAYFPTRIGVLIELIFPFSLLFCLAFIVIWLVYNPRYIVVPLAAMLLSWGGLSRYIPINKTQERDESRPGFSLMTYNIFFLLDYERKSDLANRTISQILKQNADVVCLQESQRIGVSRGLMVTPEQIDSLHTRYPYRIYSPHSINLLSKYPAELLFDTIYSESSAAAIYRVDIQGRSVNIVNLHLESIGLTPDDKALYQQLTELPNTDQLDEIKTHLLGKLVNAAERRNRQADVTAEKIEELSGNTVVCGDFNDSPLSYSVHRFHSMGFRDAYNELGRGPGITYHDNRFWFRIDHILYQGDMEARWIVRDRQKSSDHYPLITRFEWTDSDNTLTQ